MVTCLLLRTSTIGVSAWHLAQLPVWVRLVTLYKWMWGDVVPRRGDILWGDALPIYGDSSGGIQIGGAFARLDQTQFDRAPNGHPAAVDVEFAVDCFRMRAQGAQRNHKFTRDVGAGKFGIEQA